MSRLRCFNFFGFTLGGMLLALTLGASGQQQTASAPTHPSALPHKAKKLRLVRGDQPSTPGGEYGPPAPEEPKPKTPEQMDPVQPRVSYRDGLITVEAPNCTLGSILNIIHNKTGIQFDGLPIPGASDRVAVRTGPAPVAEVIAELLRGSHIDYLIVGREDSPGTVQRVMLNPRPGPPGVSLPTATNTPHPAAQEGDEADSDLQTQPGTQPGATGQVRTQQQMLDELVRQRELRTRGIQPQPANTKPDSPQR
ncbi:MAG TPA: hypothetical protein VKT33_03010 [Candidatus Angelobacter sp.]|nr:hypothetical protein [Candidatus Angelobacter sp.]